jgi:hypothetical protein
MAGHKITKCDLHIMLVEQKGRALDESKVGRVVKKNAEEGDKSLTFPLERP